MDVFQFADEVKALYERTDQDNEGDLSASDFLEEISFLLSSLED